MIPAIKQVAGDTFVFQQDSTPFDKTLLKVINTTTDLSAARPRICGWTQTQWNESWYTSRQILHCVACLVSWSIFPLKCKRFSSYRMDGWQKVLTEKDVMVVQLLHLLALYPLSLRRTLTKAPSYVENTSLIFQRKCKHYANITSLLHSIVLFKAFWLPYWILDIRFYSSYFKIYLRKYTAYFVEVFLSHLCHWIIVVITKSPFKFDNWHKDYIQTDATTNITTNLLEYSQDQSGNIVSYLMWLVEEETKVGEDDPEFLPSGATLELAQQVATEQILCHKQHNSSLCMATLQYLHDVSKIRFQ